MAWYTTGTVTVTASSNTVMGNGTNFIANARVGDAFRGPDGRWYEVTNIASATAISISPVYQGSTASAQAYSIAPMQGYVKASADALRQITETYGSTLAAIKPWATAATASIALDNLGFGATGKAIAAAANTAAAQAAIDIVKTTSAGDTTAGRVWRTNDLVKQLSSHVAVPGGVAINNATGGFFGLGCLIPGTPSSMQASDTEIPTGFWRISVAEGSTGVPPRISYGTLLNFRYNQSNSIKISSSIADDIISFKRTGGEWRSLWHDGNLNPNVLNSYTVATVPSAASNANLGIIVTNAAGAGRRPFWSNGTIWRDAAGVTLS